MIGNGHDRCLHFGLTFGAVRVYELQVGVVSEFAMLRILFDVVLCESSVS